MRFRLSSANLAVCMASIVIATTADAAEPPMSLSRAVALALERYPSIKVSEEQLEAARVAVNLARTAYLPRLDANAQLNRATHNNVFGLLLPASGMPSISGPVTPSSLSNVWGTAVGAIVSWEPFDFGLRQANVAIGETGRKRAQASVARTRFEVAALTADSFLTVVAAEQTVRAAAAGVERARIIESVIAAVVKSELRPGADLSRSRAERALAESQLAQAHQAVAEAKAGLAQLTGMEPADIVVEPGKLLEAAPGMAPGGDWRQHPRAREQQAAVEEVHSREHALDLSYVPRFNLQGAAYGRGTGANLDGSSGEAWSGLGPNAGNWAIGFSVTFPIFDFAALRSRKAIEAHNEKAESARLDLISRELKGQRDRAAASYEGAVQVSASTRAVLEAARDTERQATARYKAGLATAVELADAQRLLTQAEIDDALARLSVWRGLLAMANANGDLDSFVDRTK